MAGNPMRIAMLLAAGAAIAAAPSVPASAQTSYSPYAESPAAALARYVRTLASKPRDFSALIGAGRAALALGDTHAAGGFFGRADDVNANSPLPHAGMGAVAAAEGKPHEALAHFSRAQQLGAPIATFAADRGLAYDLLGQQPQAQADYRAALGGLDSDEARRRLALSLAISGDKAGAMEAIAPLIAKSDRAAWLTRAFVYALTGDSAAAKTAFDAAMPGSWSGVSPFVQRLPTLRPEQKAAVVNLGVFPDSNQTAYASASVPPAYSQPNAGTSAVRSDRLEGVEQLVRAPVASGRTPSWQSYSLPAPKTALPQTQVASAAPVRREQFAAPGAQSASVVRSKKIWLQLASGPNADALPRQFQRIKAKNPELFEGINPFVAKGHDRSRLLVGPFKNSADAETFAEGLDSVSAFRWTNSETDTIVPLATN